MPTLLGKTNFTQLFAMLVVLVVTGCSNLSLTIENPHDDGTVYTGDIPMSAYWVGGELEPDQFRASLNGLDITEFFIVGPTSATIEPGVDLRSKLRDGVNTLRVTVDGPHLPMLLVSNNSKFVQFLADKHGPEIHIVNVDVKRAQEEVVTEVTTELDRPWWCWADWLPGCEIRTETEEVITVVDTSTFTVEGYVRDPSGLESVSHTIREATPPFNLLSDNTSMTQIDGENFSFQLPEKAYYANTPVLIEITATDGLGRISKQTFHRAASGELPSSVSVRDKGSIPFALNSLIRRYGPGIIEDLMGNGLVDLVPGFDIGVASLRVRGLQNLSIAESSYVRYSDESNYDMEGLLAVSNLDIQFEACVIILGCGSIFANVPEVGVDFKFGIEGTNDERIARLNGFQTGVHVPSVGVGVNIIGITISTPGFVNSLIGRVVDITADFALSFLNQGWLPLVEHTVNTLLAHFIFEFQIGLINDDIPRNACTRFFLEDFHVEDGEMILEAGIAMQAGDFANRDGLGVRVTQYTPTPDRISADGDEYELVASISTNIVNQVLFGMHEAGFLDIRLPNLIVLNGRTLSARVSPMSPAHFSLRQFDLGTSEFHIWDLEIAIDALIDENDPEAGYETLASGIIRIDVPLDFAVTADVTDARIISLFTDQVNAALEGLTFSRGNRPFSAAEATAVALSAAGPLLVVAADALSALPTPRYTLPNGALPVAFWVDPDQGALKVGASATELIEIFFGPDGIIPGGPNLPEIPSLAELIASLPAPDGPPSLENIIDIINSLLFAVNAAAGGCPDF